MSFFKQIRMPFMMADGGAGGGAGTEPNPDGGQGGELTPKGAGKTFTQAELEAIIADRLAREKRKREEAERKAREEAERKALEEQGKYKEMYEALQKQLEAEKAQVLEAKKVALLLTAGYTQEQAERYVKFVTGGTEEELATAVEALKADIPPKYAFVDPSLGNPPKQTGKQAEPYEYGKSLFARLKASGRIR